MANQWFRLYAELANDPKVLVLTEALRWRYVALLCLHCDGKYQNTPDDEIALALRISVDEWHDTRKAFITRRLLTEDGAVNGWEKRQYISDIKDPTAADRQQRYRDSKRNERNAPVTSRLPEADTDTDTETEKKEEDAPAPMAQLPKASPRKIENEKPKQEIPAWDGDNDANIPKSALVGLSPNWGMPDDIFNQYVEMGWQESRLMTEVGKLKAWAISGKGSGKRRSVKGWRQTTLNWLNTESSRAR